MRLEHVLTGRNVHTHHQQAPINSLHYQVKETLPVKQYICYGALFLLLAPDQIFFPHCNENPRYVFLFWELRGLSPNFHIHVCELFIYSQDQFTYFPAAELGRLILGMYKSLTGIWMWKFVLRPHIFFSGNIFSNFLYCVLQGSNLDIHSIRCSLSRQFKLLNSWEWPSIFMYGACSFIIRQIVDEITSLMYA